MRKIEELRVVNKHHFFVKGNHQVLRKSISNHFSINRIPANNAACVFSTVMIAPTLGVLIRVITSVLNVHVIGKSINCALSAKEAVQLAGERID